MGSASEPGDEERRGADGRSTNRERTSGAGRPCPACGTAMDRRHCKYVCPRHGVVYDCSDTFW